MDPVEFNNLARNLLIENEADSAGMQEAKLRTAISRAYYAAFFKIAQVRKFQCNTAESHNRLTDDLKKEFAKRPDQMLLISKLVLLRKNRNKADYEINIPIDPDIGNQMINYADKIIADSNSLK